ncbi:hypothetical protein NS381_10535 [Pantoea stewartii]|nr:hypothetical protein NS381_10535 [Pantoea stewartii]
MHPACLSYAVPPLYFLFPVYRPACPLIVIAAWHSWSSGLFPLLFSIHVNFAKRFTRLFQKPCLKTGVIRRRND